MATKNGKGVTFPLFFFFSEKESGRNKNKLIKKKQG